MKTLVIGSGFIARTHVCSVRALGHEVTWIAGRNAERTRAFAEENNIANWTDDYEKALEGDIDIIHICTPPADHAVMIRKCLAAGKHVICEKPLCLDPREAAALAAEADAAYSERGLITALCCNVRFYPAVMEASRTMRESGKGGPMIISGSYLQEYHLPPHPDGWRFDPVLSGGQRAVSEIGTHWIDLAYSMTGSRITSVMAELDNWYPCRYRKNGMLTLEEDGEPVHVDTEDTAAVIMRFDNGGLGTLLLSETSPGHENDLSIEINDLRTSCRWDESSPETLMISEGKGMKSLRLPEISRSETFTKLFHEVYEAAEGREHSAFPSFHDGAYISAVCSAIIQSGKERRWVEIP